MFITVKPSDNIFHELGNNTYDYKDLLSELIDNSLAARPQDKMLKVQIHIYVDSEMKAQKFVISDDARGIPLEKLAVAITPAGVQTMGSLNEHGLGMKQAIAAIGRLESLITKTSDAEKALCVREFKFGNIDVDEVEFDKESGTTITVTNVKPIVSTHTTSITRSIVPYLGARYRRFLRPENKYMQLSMMLINIDTDAILHSWDITEVKPAYFHPYTRENRPVILGHKLEGNGWTAELTFGYAPKDDQEYSELGLDVPNKFHPYRTSLSTQGIDVLLHDRVILFHQLAEIGLVNQRHNDYNSLRGEIVLKHGFSTAITKNSIIHNENFSDCINQIKEILNGDRAGPGGKKENYIQHKSYPDEIPEKLLRDRLIEWLKTNPMSSCKEVSKEYAVEGIEGYIDILADGVAWELKRDQASALDVYQLFMYMDIGNISKGYLLAKSFSPGANIACKALQEKHNKDVVLAPRDQFPINQQPNPQERQDYY